MFMLEWMRGDVCMQRFLVPSFIYMMNASLLGSIEHFFLPSSGLHIVNRCEEHVLFPLE